MTCITRQMAVFCMLAAACTAPCADYSWVEWGPKGAIVRAISQESTPPTITIDGSDRVMVARIDTPPEEFQVSVWQFSLPAGVRSLAVDGVSLPAPRPQPKTVLVIGDTGCRIKGDVIQNCNGKGDGPAWCFDKIAAQAASIKPDLIIHVGDYHYRENPCPEGNKGCEGSPWGYNWPSWRSDFFEPAQPLFTAAPWVFVRGNHENCSRAWKGWFLFLDPNPIDAGTFDDCPDHPGPYRLDFGGMDVIVMDTSHIPKDYDPVPDPSTVVLFTEQINEINRLAVKPSWTASHRPFWALSSYKKNGKVAMSALDLTLRRAIAASKTGKLSPQIRLALAGHIHQFEYLTFEDGRPAQVIAGASGTELDPPMTPAFLAANKHLYREIGLDPDDFEVFTNFNFLVIRVKPKCWGMELIKLDGGVAATYELAR